jgi:hydrogenase-4 component B
MKFCVRLRESKRCSRVPLASDDDSSRLCACHLPCKGACALLASRRPKLTTAVGALGTLLACTLAMVPVVQTLLGRHWTSLQLPWQAPTQDLLLGMDPCRPSSWPPCWCWARWPRSMGAPIFWPTASARPWAARLAHSACSWRPWSPSSWHEARCSFLVAWEAMTLSSYLLVTFEHEEAEVRRAGLRLPRGRPCWRGLPARHVLASRPSGGRLGLRFLRRDAAPGATLSALLFILATVGFGMKAGFLPLHVWLPEAHAAAPSHVSALMSGVMIKLGLYGLLRITTF